jgi:hypothetical protein
MAHLSPLRAYFTPNPEYEAHIRFGPDVLVICENWLTRWERHEDTLYRDKILRMLSHFREPGSFAASSIWGYDPKTGDMKLVERNSGVHFNFIFGTPYIMHELLAVLEDDVLANNLYDMGQVQGYHFPQKEEWSAAWGVPSSGFSRVALYQCGVAAIAAGAREDKALADEVWDVLLSRKVTGELTKTDDFRVPLDVRDVVSSRVHKPLKEAAYITGNSSSQWGSNMIVALASIGDQI